MIAIVAVLLGFPIGYVVRHRATAVLAFGLAWSWAFTFQSVYLLLDAMDGDRAAFTPGRFPLDYGIVSLAIGIAGIGLVVLGSRTASRRSRRPAVA